MKSESHTGDGRKCHILAWYHYEFTLKTRLEVVCSEPRADLHLTPEEQRPIVGGHYWVVLSGGNLNMTVKHWAASRVQSVVDQLLACGIRCVQIGGVVTDHVHPPLQNVTSMVGKTENIRDLFNVIANAAGVICPITGCMHIAAAFHKPCVCVAGGREEPWFEAYVDDWKAFGSHCAPVRVPHRYLHTMGQLSCCQRGCWKDRVVPIFSLSDQRRNKKTGGTLCEQPLRTYDPPLPACLDLIQPSHVVNAVLSYYADGTLTLR